MRLRDLGILIVCALAALFSLQSGGNLALHKAFYEEIDVGLFDNHHYPKAQEKLPPPLVTDLDGDGKNEVVVVTREPQLRVLDPSVLQRPTASKNLITLPARHEATLLPTVGISTGRLPVAMASGYLQQRTSGERQHHQVIVVVTEGWTVLCFDSSLKLIWETNVQESFPPGHFVKEVAVVVSPSSVRKEDQGVIIVGGSMDVTKGSPHYHGHSDDKEHKRREGDEELSEEQVADEEDRDVSHFSYYALDGRTGSIRWKHEAGDFHKIHAQEDFVHPQHNYKLETPSHIQHAGEMDWRVFRDSVLSALPHQWQRREDTSFKLAHFERQKAVEKRVDETAKHSENAAEQAPEAAIPAHRLSGLTRSGFNRLFNKKPVTDVEKPNVLVATMSSGMEVVHLFTGRPVCTLPLADGAHADINGDGIVDHVQSIGGHSPIYRPTSTLMKPPVCYALVTTGIPPQDQLFNGSICHRGGALDMASLRARVEDESEDEESVQTTGALLLDRYDPFSTAASRWHYDAIFLVSTGKVTCYTDEGSLRWQIPTRSRWSMPRAESSSVASMADFLATSFVPSLRSLYLSAHAQDEAILAVGQFFLTILSPNGAVLAEAGITDSPVAIPVVGDFNNDGLNDIIITTRGAHYGYVTERRMGSVLFSALTGGMLLVMALVFLNQFMVQRPKGNKGDIGLRRSTD